MIFHLDARLIAASFLFGEWSKNGGVVIMNTLLGAAVMAMVCMLGLQSAEAKTPIDFQICSIEDAHFNVAAKCFKFHCNVRRNEYDRIARHRRVCTSACGGSYFRLQACERTTCDKRILFKDIARNPALPLPKCDQIRWKLTVE